MNYKIKNFDDKKQSYFTFKNNCDKNNNDNSRYYLRPNSCNITSNIKNSNYNIKINNDYNVNRLDKLSALDNNNYAYSGNNKNKYKIKIVDNISPELSFKYKDIDKVFNTKTTKFKLFKKDNIKNIKKTNNKIHSLKELNDNFNKIKKLKSTLIKEYNSNNKKISDINEIKQKIKENISSINKYKNLIKNSDKIRDNKQILILSIKNEINSYNKL